MMDNITANTPAAPLDQTAIIQGIMAKQAQGHTVNVFELALSLDITEDLSKVRDYLVKSDLCTRQEWNKALQNKRIVDRLGVNPRTAVELVDVYVKQMGFHVDYQKVVHLPAMQDVMAINKDTLRHHRELIAYQLMQQQKEASTITLKRDLRLLCDELRMGFSDRSIDDAVAAWFEQRVGERLLAVYGMVKYEIGINNKDATKAAWENVVSQFDTVDHDGAFVEAVLRKFIWQVKRKMLGLKITGHLMPVLISRQGSGKSTFVRDMLIQPVQELACGANFTQIQDERNIDLWRNYVLFMDEMGFAGKSDADIVKGRITDPYLPMRPMRTNDSIQVRQCATFIGCSNKELDQLIRDETGNRRFVGLRFLARPDWSRLKGLDPLVLWNSVDEHGDDPTEAFADALAERQEDVREKSQVEQWLDQHATPTSLVGKKQSSSGLYKDYSLWADTFYPNRAFDVRTWGKEFNRLIKSGQVEDWAIGGRSNGNSTYVWG